MVGAAEGDFKEANGGVWRERWSEFVDVLRGVDEGDAVIFSSLNLKG